MASILPAPAHLPATRGERLEWKVFFFSTTEAATTWLVAVCVCVCVTLSRRIDYPIHQNFQRMVSLSRSGKTAATAVFPLQIILHPCQRIACSRFIFHCIWPSKGGSTSGTSGFHPVPRSSAREILSCIISSKGALIGM